jgi:hypothetical protein
MKREDYLNSPEVTSFIKWFERRLDLPEGYRHEFYLVKAKRKWQCNCLYEAYENYWWPFNMICPIQGKRVLGKGNQETFMYMNFLSETFRAAIQTQDKILVQNSIRAMLTWGGVLASNQKRTEDMGDNVCDYFRQVKRNLNLSEISLGNHDDIIMNSGFTKLYTLFVDDFIMYDGRVGAALGLLGRIYAQEAGLSTIPETIKFSYGNGKVSPDKQIGTNRRNPSCEKCKLPNFNNNPQRQLNDNIKASWLVKALANETASRFARLPQRPLLNERLTAIQSALFMIGYDVSCLKDYDKNGQR